MPLKYVIPSECGLNSSAHSVGRRLAKVMEACEAVNRWVCTGPGQQEVEQFAYDLRDKLRAEGWRITTDKRDRWRVLPPK